MAEKKIDLKNIKYLSFEGGGGKGIVYLGVVQALEEKVKRLNDSINSGKYESDNGGGFMLPEIEISDEPIPLFQINTPIEDRRFKGISGSSAGALTAMLLAMGVNSKDISAQFERTTQAVIAGENMEISIFEKFFDDPDVFNYRSFPLGKVSNYNIFPWMGLVSKVINGSFILKNRTILRWFKTMNPTKSLHSLQYSNDTMLKKLALSDAEKRKKGRKMNYKNHSMVEYNPPSPIPNKTFITIPKLDKLKKYIESLMANRGIFSGFELLNYIESLIQEFLLEKIELEGNPYGNKKPGQVTFLDFFNLTGTDLIVTGTNVTQGLPKYFSVYHTPDFPVAYAVTLSMNLPIIFRPVVIGDRVHKGYDLENPKNKDYLGFWVDGGMLNNYPIHAFDNIEVINQIKGIKESRNLLYRNKPVEVEIAMPSKGSKSFCNCILGFQIMDIDKPKPSAEQIKRGMFEEDDSLTLLRYSGQLLGTLLYPSEDGQIRSGIEEDFSIKINSTGLATTDFTSPKINIQRSIFYDKKKFKGMKDENEKAAKVKEARIKEAKLKVTSRVNI